MYAMVDDYGLVVHIWNPQLEGNIHVPFGYKMYKIPNCNDEFSLA